MQEIAIAVNNITKAYKLYDKPTDRLRESLGLSKKKRYKEIEGRVCGYYRDQRLR